MSCWHLQVFKRLWSMSAMPAELFLSPGIKRLYMRERALPCRVKRPVSGTSWPGWEPASSRSKFYDSSTLVEATENRRWNRLSCALLRVLGRILLYALHKRKCTAGNNWSQRNRTNEFGQEQRISLWGSERERRLRKRLRSWLHHQEDCGHPRPNNSKPLGRQEPAIIVPRYVLEAGVRTLNKPEIIFVITKCCVIF